MKWLLATVLVAATAVAIQIPNHPRHLNHKQRQRAAVQQAHVVAGDDETPAASLNDHARDFLSSFKGRTNHGQGPQIVRAAPRAVATSSSLAQLRALLLDPEGPRQMITCLANDLIIEIRDEEADFVIEETLEYCKEGAPGSPGVLATAINELNQTIQGDKTTIEGLNTTLNGMLTDASYLQRMGTEHNKIEGLEEEVDRKFSAVEAHEEAAERAVGELTGALSSIAEISVAIHNSTLSDRSRATGVYNGAALIETSTVARALDHITKLGVVSGLHSTLKRMLVEGGQLDAILDLLDSMRDALKNQLADRRLADSETIAGLHDDWREALNNRDQTLKDIAAIAVEMAGNAETRALRMRQMATAMTNAASNIYDMQHKDALRIERKKACAQEAAERQARRDSFENDLEGLAKLKASIAGMDTDDPDVLEAYSEVNVSQAVEDFICPGLPGGSCREGDFPCPGGYHCVNGECQSRPEVARGTLACHGNSCPADWYMGEVHHVVSTYQSMCAIRSSDNKPFCLDRWGDWQWRYGTAIPDVAMSELVGDWTSVCGKRMDNGEWLCFGYVYPSVPAQIDGQLVGDGIYSYCAIHDDSTVDCYDFWQQHYWYQQHSYYSYSPLPTNEPFKSVSPGYFGACGIKEDDTAICEGTRAWWWVGDRFPQNIEGRWKQMKTKVYHTIGIKESGELEVFGGFGWTYYGWNRDWCGVATPPAGNDWVEVYPSYFCMACARRANGTVKCWGKYAEYAGLTHDIPDVAHATVLYSGARQLWTVHT